MIFFIQVKKFLVVEKTNMSKQKTAWSDSTAAPLSPAKPLVFLMGPTAIGKTALALAIARACNCEIIGVDSMQIYKFMDIGTAKPTPLERRSVRHHLIDYVFPDEVYSAARFVADCQQAIADIHDRGKAVLLAGGTGLYFRALVDGIFDAPVIADRIRAELLKERQEKGLAYLFTKLQAVDPESAARIHANDSYRIIRALEIYQGTGKSWAEFIKEHQALNRRRRPAPLLLKIGVERDRQELYARINQRCEGMIQQGLLAEVRGLLAKGYAPELPAMQALGYRHLLDYINGAEDWERCLELLARDTRRYAKRQLTWFKRDSEICWFHPEMQDQVIAKTAAFLSSTDKG